MQSDFITVGGQRVAALIKDMCEYKQRNQERKSVKALDTITWMGQQLPLSAPVKMNKQDGGGCGWKQESRAWTDVKMNWLQILAQQ